jgi:hypothetical protein
VFLRQYLWLLMQSTEQPRALSFSSVQVVAPTGAALLQRLCATRLSYNVARALL